MSKPNASRSITADYGATAESAQAGPAGRVVTITTTTSPSARRDGIPDPSTTSGVHRRGSKPVGLHSSVAAGERRAAAAKSGKRGFGLVRFVVKRVPFRFADAFLIAALASRLLNSRQLREHEIDEGEPGRRARGGSGKATSRERGILQKEVR